MLNLILFGPPGSGKGTQAKKLADHNNLLHISTGDLFRSEMKKETDLGKRAKSYINAGELVPDEVTIGMLRNKVKDHPEVEGFIFDGFPRTIPQAESLDKLMSEINTSISGLIALEVEEDEIVQRLLERGKTSGRKDDQDESIIRSRIEVYRSETTPVYNYYDEKDRSYTVDGMGKIDEIFERLCTVIDSL